jgi:uncharacterized protein (DUF2141 family)
MIPLPIRSTLFLAAVLSLLALAAAAADASRRQAPVADGALIGTVSDTVGSPVFRALLTILETGDEVTTNSDGRYLFMELEPGRYTLRLTHERFDTLSVADVEVLPDTTLRRDFVMSGR